MNTCKQFTAEGCSLEWDRKGNPKQIRYCPLHAAAPELLKAAILALTISYKDDEPLGERIEGMRDNLRLALARAEGR